MPYDGGQWGIFSYLQNLENPKCWKSPKVGKDQHQKLKGPQLHIRIFNLHFAIYG